MRINRPSLLTSIVLLWFAVHIQAQGKADWKTPDVSGVVTAISADGKLLTIQTAKGDKNQAAQTANVQMPAADHITYSQVGRGGDSPREGYLAQVWLEPGANDRAARISFTGHESLKSLSRPADVEGTVTAVGPDGKGFTVTTRATQKGQTPEVHQVNLTGETDVRFAAVSAGGAKVQQDYQVQVWLDPAKRENAAVARFTGHEGAAVKKSGADNKPDVSGTVVSVTADGKTLVVEGKPTAKNEPAPHREVRLADAAEVVYNGVALDGAKPTEGYQVQASLDGDKVSRVLFNGLPKDKGADISSPVVAVSPDGGTITVEIPSKAKNVAPERREIQITDAVVAYNGVRAGELKPTEGYQARVWLSPGAEGAAAKVLFSKSGSQKQ